MVADIALSSTDVDFVSEKLAEYQNKVVHSVENCLNRDLENLLQGLRQKKLQATEFQDINYSNTWKNHQFKAKQSTVVDNNENKCSPKGKVHNKYQLPDKIFVKRDSYITVLKGVKHMKILVHLIYHVLFIFFLSDLSYNYFVNGIIRLGFATFKAGLIGIHFVFGIWLIEHLFVFALYYAFKCWASIFLKLQRQPPLQRFWSHSCLILHVGSQIVFFYVAVALVSRLQLPFISAAILLLENCRLLMKMHAFVRTNTDRVLQGKRKTDMDEEYQATVLPTFSKYFYFLFAPTLIYRDNYPRTACIRWSFALKRLLDVVLVAFLYANLYERHIVVYFNDIGKTPIAYSDLLVKWTSMIWPGVLIFVSGNYMLLHAWMNFGAELTRFGDRMFYKDWWTAENYDSFYRDWNIVIYDWLYEYIYKESYQHLFKGSKIIASLLVFCVSAIMHELLIGFSLQLYFPIMFISFGVIGVAFVFLTRHYNNYFNNFFVWCSLIYGNGVLVYGYSLEYYARWNCPKSYSTFYDYFVPAIFNCPFK